jgi:LL-diaminopimelate aminotransferase
MRLGFVAGNTLLVRALADVKDNCDSGQFKVIQRAACVALEHHEIHEIHDGVRAKNRRRLEKLVATLRPLGFDAALPGGPYFSYVRAPIPIDVRTFSTAEDAAASVVSRRFAGAGVLPEPFGECGIDPTADTFDCSDYAKCEWPPRGALCLRTRDALSRCLLLSTI